MTPAIEVLEDQGYRFTLHLYSASRGGASGINAAEKLALDPRQVFKSLVVVIDETQPVIVLIPVSTNLNMKRLARTAGGKRASMMASEAAEKITGYVVGGICPIGMKRAIDVYIDESIRNYQNVFISGGKRGVELELAATDLLEITGATEAELAD